MNPRLSKLTVNAQAAVTAKLLDGGSVEFLEGEPPADPDTPPAADQILCRAQLASTAFGAPRDGVLTANKVDRAVAIKTGEPSWFRLVTREGEPVADGLVGTSNADAVGNVKTLIEGQFVDVTGFIFKIARKR
jgi:hypothetical protein